MIAFDTRVQAFQTEKPEGNGHHHMGKSSDWMPRRGLAAALAIVPGLITSF